MAKNVGVISVSIEDNIWSVKAFIAAMGQGDRQALFSITSEDIECIIPGKNWPLAGTHRGHRGLENLLGKASEAMETSFVEPPEFVAQGDRVMVIGVAEGKVRATNKPWKENRVFAITVRDGKLTNIREYVDTQALARASLLGASDKHRHLSLPSCL